MAELDKKKSEVVLLRNQGELLPITNLQQKRILHISFDAKGKDFFQNSLALYAPVLNIRMRLADLPGRMSRIRELADGSNLVILSLHNSVSYSGLSTTERLAIRDFWQGLYKRPDIITTFFGSEEELQKLDVLSNSPVLLFSPSEHPINQEFCAQIIYGAISSQGRLRKDIGQAFHKGNGLRTNGDIRLTYNKAEAVNWDTERLKRRIDSLIKMAIDSMAFPGCQVLVAKNNQVVFHQSYGYHNYDKTRPVKVFDVYDLASVTKISAALPAIMYLKDEEKLRIDAPLSNYWPDFIKSNKRDLQIRPILAHQAGLTPYIVFWEKTQKRNGKFKGGTFKRDSSELYSVKVYKDLYMNSKYRKKMYKAVRKSALDPDQGYVYSGLSFLIYPQIVKNLSGMDFDKLLNEKFFDRLGAGRLDFNPWKKIPITEIVPTEFDSLFRKELVHGYVHDEAAAMMGGVSGNSGLFSNANDLAKLMQMYLNMGTYGGEQYISRETMKEFSSYAYKKQGNRRGLGFDKPALNGNGSYIAKDASSL
ncbi:serine hydrolase domain-containing protein, partial [Moorena bouillonii]|uniref:serine hydrolase domain-containing protein n=1 Tax=Moorena bouillonii TaxID=207920 RepID=UPI0013013E44